ncbi:MAG: ferredoxin [Acidimicrobiia bacterium]
MVKIWIDQDLCMGAGTCEQLAPDLFEARGDGLWVVKEDARHWTPGVLFDGGTGPGHGAAGASGQARVPAQLVDVALEAAEECPGECIFVEV